MLKIFFDNLLLWPIVLPFIGAMVCLVIPKNIKILQETAVLLFAILTFEATAIIFYLRPVSPVSYVFNNLTILSLSANFLAAGVLVFIGLFGVLILLYALKFMQESVNARENNVQMLLTLGASCGAVLANNLMLLVVFWGIVGFTLYLLINMGKDAQAAAKKSFIIIGGSDSLMIMGIGIIWMMCGTLDMDKIRIVIAGSNLATVAFIMMAIAAFAKAGAMPFHSWVPDCAEAAPVHVTAFLPAALDKLLGIYLLARLCLDFFVLNISMSFMLMAIGAITVIAAVMMALVQHDMKKLMGYHAVSQVGYMILGIGTGTPIGIAGGLFHMINHAIYKSCLFLTAGAVEKQTGTTDLDKLGNLSKVMPITFFCTFVAALSISGVPPFNGFVSKWMVYQGVIEAGSAGDHLWVLWLAAAMFGSALTLASFLKVIHAVFFGPGKEVKVHEVRASMWVPMLILAILCIVFGVFAYQLPLQSFIIPITGEVEFLGVWVPTLTTSLLLIGLVLGFVIYWLGNIKQVRYDASYVGGEVLSKEETHISGIDFYNTIKQEIGIIRWIYSLAERKMFDIYEIGKNIAFGIGGFFRYLHNGVLPTYLVWTLLGMLVLLLQLLF